MQQTSNTSGQGVNANVPPEANYWNWGAAMFTVLWLRSNNLTSRDVDAFIQSKGRSRAGRILFYVLGAEANELAWRQRQWPSVQVFAAVQRRWNICGLGFLGLLSGAILYLAGVTLYALLS